MTDNIGPYSRQPMIISIIPFKAVSFVKGEITPLVYAYKISSPVIEKDCSKTVFELDSENPTIYLMV